MSNGWREIKPLRVGAEEYARLRDAVLWRGGWKCQFCGSMRSLEVHHQQFRSHSGDDKPENLIILCGACHFALHSCRGKPDARVSTSWTSLKFRIEFWSLEVSARHPGRPRYRTPGKPDGTGLHVPVQQIGLSVCKWSPNRYEAIATNTFRLRRFE